MFIKQPNPDNEKTFSISCNSGGDGRGGETWEPAIYQRKGVSFHVIRSVVGTANLEALIYGVVLKPPSCEQLAVQSRAEMLYTLSFHYGSIPRIRRDTRAPSRVPKKHVLHSA